MILLARGGGERRAVTKEWKLREWGSIFVMTEGGGVKMNGWIILKSE